jgi:hypothetical protein
MIARTDQTCGVAVTAEAVRVELTVMREARFPGAAAFGEARRGR